MGTASEWLSAVVWGGLWGTLMAWWMARHQNPNFTRRQQIVSLVLWAPAGLWFGIVTTFHGRAWRRPLVFVNIGLWVGIYIVSWAFRKKRAI